MNVFEAFPLSKQISNRKPQAEFLENFGLVWAALMLYLIQIKELLVCIDMGVSLNGGTPKTGPQNDLF